MRTSRVSREAARLAETLSSRRRTVKREEDAVKEEEDASSGLSSAPTTDIEDLLTATKKRKRPSKPSRAVKQDKNVKNKQEEQETKAPPNWQAIYDAVKSMRERNPTAPVDTMGCAELYWRSSSPRDRRFQTLIALMLSSQTKDTVTAAAMQRLHTQLGQEAADETADKPVAEVWDHDHQTAPSTLTLENVLAVSPARLNELIGAVGFHNNKTKYIKATAVILHDEFDSDIPSTIQGLTRLPGVGPKMAYLCMSSAWDRHEGIGVDVHVHRITNLWGWNKTKTPEATRAALESWLPRDKWHEINKLLVGLGQTVCLPVGRRCAECDLSGTGLCIAEVKGKGKGSKKKSTSVKTDKEEDIDFPVVKDESKIDIKIES